MEEKLYFKPSNYGKGSKTKQKKGGDEEKGHKMFKLVGFMFFLFVIIFIVTILLRGKTITTGQYPANIRNEALECTSQDILYSKITSVNSQNKELKLNLVFVGSEKINTIGVRYTLNYANRNEAVSAEALSHAELNNGLAALGFSSEKFENKFTLIDNSLTISIHGNSAEINDDTKEYFMFEKTAELPKTLDEYRSYYSSIGFECKSTADKL